MAAHAHALPAESTATQPPAQPTTQPKPTPEDQLQPRAKHRAQADHDQHQQLVQAKAKIEAEAEPVGLATRRFLKPIVGIDPGEVRLHRGDVAARVTAAHHAEAVTSGHDIFLGPGSHDVDTNPRSRALLAHELTHVAQQTQAGPLASEPEIEAPALQVEATIRAAGAEHTDGSSWNGLPAPWEPLPNWLSAQSASAASPTYDGAPSPAGVPEPAMGAAPAMHARPTAPAPAMTGARAAATPVFTAALDRELPPVAADSSTTTEPNEEQGGGEVEPDLDALARQVYLILRRRLASESRRLS